MDHAVFKMAVAEMRAHPSVVDIRTLPQNGKGVELEVDIDLGFGARWIANGQSPTGVFPVETLQLGFPEEFPVKTVRPSLRPDFSREHAHVQPYRDRGRVVPCLVDGPLSDFIAARGFFPLIDQAVHWLNGAAADTLIDAEQGWEPIRRDDYVDFLAMETGQIRELATRDGGFKFLRAAYVSEWSEGLTATFAGQLWSKVNVKEVVFEEEREGKRSKFATGMTGAIVVWPGKLSDGRPFTCDRFVSDDGLVDVRTLLERAKIWGVERQLRDAAKLLGQGEARDKIHPVPIVILVRRPFHMKDEDSDLEICSYIVPLPCAGTLLSDPAAQVRPIAVRDQITVDLLRSMSGTVPAESWALVGCGSLGSKIALHRCRSGNGPDIVCDKAMLQPHNAARHGLHPSHRWSEAGWLGPKAEKLAATLGRLGKEPRAIRGDYSVLLKITDDPREPAPKWLVNTTASFAVREGLARARSGTAPRGIEACLYAAGTLGLFAVEGSGRNPDGAELVGEFYREAYATPPLGARLFSEGGELARRATGEGCASITMVMSDSTLSVMAAAMAEAFHKLNPESQAGQLFVFQRHGLGLDSTETAVDACRRMVLEGLDGWSVSLAARAERKIQAEIGRHRRVETGGILIGWTSLITTRIYIVDVLPAPSDSKRSSREFVLGVKGVTQKLADLNKKTGGALQCVGTWHSHLGANTPSTLDRFSAAMVGLSSLRPMTFLIKGENGFRCISTHLENASRG